MVNYLGHYETLHDDYAAICARLGLDATELPRHNRRTFRDYRDYYDDATRELVGDVWRKDIEMFGYDFEGLTGSRTQPAPAA